MRFLIHYKLVLDLLLIFIAVLVITSIIEGYIDGRNRVMKGPREEMYWCHLHGHFRKKHCLPLFPELGGRAQNSFVCPICYRQTVFTDVDKKAKVH